MDMKINMKINSAILRANIYSFEDNYCTYEGFQEICQTTLLLLNVFDRKPPSF